MKLARTGALCLATIFAMDYGAHAANAVRGSVHNGPDMEVAKKDDDHARKLWGKQYDTSYTEHCGCTYDMIKELAAAEMSIISDLNPLLYSDGFIGYLVIVGIAIEIVAKVGYLLLRLFDCGCEDGGPTKEEFDSGYKLCCCDADLVKDIFIAKMHELASIPDCILALGYEAFFRNLLAVAFSNVATIYCIFEGDPLLDELNPILDKLDEIFDKAKTELKKRGAETQAQAEAGTLEV